MKKLSLLDLFLFLASIAIFVFVGCDKANKEQPEAEKDNIEKMDVAAETLAKVRELEKQNTFVGYLQARDLFFILTKKEPALGIREDVLYEILKVHCLHLKLAFANEDIIDKRTLIQMDYGLIVYTLAKGYINFHPSGRHCPLMQKIISYWKDPPVPLPEEIKKQPFNIGKYNLERFIHGMKNFGGVEIIDFYKTQDWEKYEKELGT